MMSKPTTKQTSSQTTPYDYESRPTKTKVALVVEHPIYEMDARVIDELVHFLPPTQTEISLIHLLKDVTTGLPVRTANMDTLPQTILDRTQRQSEIQHEFRIILEQLSYTITDEQTYGLHAENLQDAMHYIQESSPDLAVFCAEYATTTSSAIRHHAFIPLIMHLPISALLLKRPLVKGRLRFKVLLGVDESEASMTAARKLGLLLPPESMEVTLATVQSPVYQENVILAPFVNQDVLNDALETNANMVFEMAKDILDTNQIPVTQIKRLIGSPGSELGYLAQQEEPDLVVVGSHNLKGFMAWVMGSVSSQLLHWDTHNILIVR